MGRSEALVISVPASIRLLGVGPERILVLRRDGVGHAGWIQELFVVAEDDEEEDSGETELDEEGNDVRPGASIPGSVAPCTRRGR